MDENDLLEFDPEFIRLSQYKFYYVTPIDILDMYNDTLFSKLPFEVLGHIFSFIPTREKYLEYLS